ncbi:MAG TPA: phosphopantetheine-binding protein [Nocardioidaceae bacterium]|nr:phosphopantetheine-binding protein [Nocardioidaceae bacterium]
MTTLEQTRDVVGAAIRRIVPDADLTTLDPDTELRRAYELDSLDFLGFVELLSQSTGVRIDEDDYPDLVSLRTCQAFLQRRAT